MDKKIFLYILQFIKKEIQNGSYPISTVKCAAKF